MASRPLNAMVNAMSRLSAVSGRPMVLACLPAVMLVGFWIGGDSTLVMMALVLPVLFVIHGLIGGGAARQAGPTDRATLTTLLDRALARPTGSGRACAALAVALDHPDDALRDLDDRGRAAVETALIDRIAGVLRDSDRLARLDATRLAIALPDLRRADHAALVQIAGRLQAALAEPISVAGQRVFVTLSVGFCLPGKLSPATGRGMIDGAEAALAAAWAAGGNTVRGYDDALPNTAPVDADLAAALGRALAAGEILPWFQPQIATAGSGITGVEALARWDHPERGLLPPADFLPAIHAAGLSRRLGEVMLYAALQALRDWDRDGLDIPGISINFSHRELADPDLADRVRWELDRFDIAPDRLTVELLETALTGDIDAVEANLRALAGLGCRIDLDDFGTGATSIASIRRFAVTRLKIDRSFVTRVDSDTTQANMVTALVTMARGLGIDTLAEGVETVAELARVTELGCDAVQGFAVVRPMPAGDIPGWVAAWRARQPDAARVRNVTTLPRRGARGKTA